MADADARKPIVAIISSDPEDCGSTDSELLAQFLGGLLFIGQYSRVHLVRLPSGL